MIKAKKFNLKRTLSLALAVSIILTMFTGLFSVQAGAATSGYYTYSVSNGKATITGVDTSISGDVTIPSTLGGYHSHTVIAPILFICKPTFFFNILILL